jgi:prepilin-type N-terminal cleavage/methylation domain-containing protein
MPRASSVLVPVIRHTRARRAFTLLELTVGLALAALLFAVAAPHLAAMRAGAAVRAAVADAGSTFALARESAIVARALTAVVIDTVHGTVTVRRAGVLVIRRTIGTAYGVHLGANRDSVVYDSRGLGFGVSNLTLIIRRGAVVDTLSMSRLGRLRY